MMTWFCVDCVSLACSCDTAQVDNNNQTILIIIIIDEIAIHVSFKGILLGLCKDY